MLSSFRQILQYDPILGHKFVPNQTAVMKYGNGSYLIETDDFGFRNSKKMFSGRKLKIVCLGDSFTAGDGLSNQYRFTDLLEKMYDCEVINLGVPGFGIDQQILAYQEYANHFEHDVVLFTPFLADLERCLLAEREGIDRANGKHVYFPKPYFKVINGQLVLLNSPVPQTKRVKAEVKKKAPTIIEKNPILRNIKIGVWRIRNAVKSGMTAFRVQVLNKSTHPELDSIQSPEWQITLPLLQKLKELKGDRDLFIIPFPLQRSVFNKEPTKHYIANFKKVADQNTFVYDISDTLKAHHIHLQETVYFNICWHFSHNGHKIVANRIGEILNSRYDISGVPPLKHELDNQKDDVILGLSCFYHDAAAAIIKNGQVIAAAQEERFTRVKHDKSFPVNAINYCLEALKLEIQQVDAIVYYDFETWTIERTLWNAFALSQNKDDFWNKHHTSLTKKLFLSKIIRKRTGYQGPVFKCQHHISHAAGAYYASPFDDAAILVIDGVGEWACTTIARGIGTKIEILAQQNYPHSVGLLYSAFTYYTGFKVNSGEYKMMGLAPYGTPRYVDLIKDHIVSIADDGSIALNVDYFSFQDGEAMINQKFENLFGAPPRKEEQQITKREMDLAASIQVVLEEIVIKLANHARDITGSDFLVMSGGVALNCVSNGLLFDHTAFKDFYFQPASGDAGGAIGCAWAYYFQKNPEASKALATSSNPLLGPEFSESEILAFLNSKVLPFEKLQAERRAQEIASMLAQNKIIGYFDGRMEFGPRALGARSIMANPLAPEMQSTINLKIKYRESFRPFAPIYLEERTAEYFDFDRPSPYMLVVRKLNKKLQKKTDPIPEGEENLLKIINQERSEIPAITHVDYSARLQSVNAKDNPRVHAILKAFEVITGKGVLVNTSFNVRGEPIVCTPFDAYKCFMRTEMDVLILGDFVLSKEQQPAFVDEEHWQETFTLD